MTYAQENNRKVLVIGLDAATPELVFEQLKEHLPNLNRLCANGIYGPLRSCDPPITIPAWLCMFTGKTPQQLKLHGFRHRNKFSYTDFWIADSTTSQEKTIWQIIQQAEKKSCIIGVPPSYPPQPVNGCLVSCFAAVDTRGAYTFPADLKKEIESLVGEYLFDVPFRTQDRHLLHQLLLEMTQKRFKVIKYLLREKPWDLFVFVEIGLDRIQHAFWRFWDKQHHLYQPGNEFENVIPDYYKYLDLEIGKLLEMVEQDTVILVVSDHGAKGMKGVFYVNEWLHQQGYLKLKQWPEEIMPLEQLAVDWSKTVAWGWGGYPVRIFLNLQGREAQGAVTLQDYQTLRERIAQKLTELKDPDNQPMQTKLFFTGDIYDSNQADITAYLDNLNYRSSGTLGHRRLFLKENDLSSGDAVHAQEGIFILFDPASKQKGKTEGLNIQDVAATVLSKLGVEIPQDITAGVAR